MREGHGSAESEHDLKRAQGVAVTREAGKLAGAGFDGLPNKQTGSADVLGEMLSKWLPSRKDEAADGGCDGKGSPSVDRAEAAAIPVGLYPMPEMNRFVAVGNLKGLGMLAAGTQDEGVLPEMDALLAKFNFGAVRERLGRLAGSGVREV